MSKKSIMAAILVVIPLLIGGTLAYGRAQQPQTEVISASAFQALLPGPPERTGWVPFTADVTRILPNGNRAEGRFYRKSDGSTRWDTGSTVDTIDRITINNVTRAEHYEWDPKRGWLAQPMELPPGGWRPWTPREKAIAAMTPAGYVEGVQVFAMDRVKFVEYLAPRLDMFSLKTEWKLCGVSVPNCGFYYSNIKIGEPAATLFELQPDAPVTRSSKPGGIRKVK